MKNMHVYHHNLFIGGERISNKFMKVQAMEGSLDRDGRQ